MKMKLDQPKVKITGTCITPDIETCSWTIRRPPEKQIIREGKRIKVRTLKEVESGLRDLFVMPPVPKAESIEEQPSSSTAATEPPVAAPPPLPIDAGKEYRNMLREMLPNLYVYPIEEGALTNIPIFEESLRGKNWLAVISPDPRSPGGLQRQFAEKARGKYIYMVDEIKVGDAIEFGADFLGSKGRREPKRWYGVVAAKTETELYLAKMEDASKALQTAREIAPLVTEFMYAQDPILAEVASQICSSGICLAKRSKLPICSPAQARKLENCILDIKAKLPAKCKPYWSKPPKKQPGGCYSPFSVCRASLGCRLGGAKKYEAKA